MDVNPGSAPSRQDRRERILGVLLLGAIRVCCKLFAVPRPDPDLPAAAAVSIVPFAGPSEARARSWHEDRGPPVPLFSSVR